MANLDLLNQFWKRTEQEQEFRSYAPAMRKLRPFTLDAELAGIVGQLAKTNPKTLRSFLQTARLPYPEMWLEADFSTAFQHIGTPIGGWRLHDADPVRIGWLLHEAPPGSDTISITRIASVPDPDDGEVKALIYPVTHMISATTRLDAQNAFNSLRGRIDDEVLRAIRDVNADPTFQLLAWGGDRMAGHRVIRREGKGPQIEAAKETPLYQTNVAVLEPRMLQMCANPVTPDGDTPYNRTRNIIESGMVDQMGEIGFVVAALALLNEVPVKYVPYKPTGTMRAGGRLKPFMTSSIVTIEVPASRRRMRDIEDHLRAKGREASRRARHEVRGYWLHAKALPKSEKNTHRWERCEDREGFRMWIPHHERGDAKLGWVSHTYHGVRSRGRIPGIEEGQEHGNQAA